MENLPQKDSKDVCFSILKAAINAVPYVGGPATEVMSMFLSSPLEKRRENWLNKVANDLEKLLEKVDEHEEIIKRIQSDDYFITTLSNATQIAILTHHEEKLEALKNITFNVLKVNEISEKIKINSFIFYLERFEPVHLHVLEFLGNFTKYKEIYNKKEQQQNMHVTYGGGGVGRYWDELFGKEFPSTSSLMRLVIKDLKFYDLINHDNIDLINGNDATSIGNDFLKYIYGYKIDNISS